MRIDPNLQYLQNAQPDAVQGTKSHAPQQTSESGKRRPETTQTDGGDTVQLSGTVGESATTDGSALANARRALSTRGCPATADSAEDLSTEQ